MLAALGYVQERGDGMHEYVIVVHVYLFEEQKTLLCLQLWDMYKSEEMVCMCICVCECHLYLFVLEKDEREMLAT
jgi:hypothetical protein